MADDELDERVKREGIPDPKRVKSRARAMRKKGGIPGDEKDVGDAEQAAERLLGESEERTEHDPAPRDLDDDRVERRHSDEWTPSPDDS